MAIAFVKISNARADADASTIATTFGSAVTGGNLIVVFCAWFQNDRTPTCSDNLGNTYTSVNKLWSTTGGGTGVAMFYAKNVAGGTPTVTVNYGGLCGFREIFAAEYSGADTTAPFDDDGTANALTAGAGTGNANTSAVTAAENGSLYAAGVYSAGGMGAAAPANSFNERADTTGAGGFAQFQDLVQATAASLTSAWTVTEGGEYSGILGVFKPAGDTTRRARVSFTEMEVPNAPRRARVSFAELEIPDALRRARVSFAEMEVPEPTADRRARVSFAEMEVPTAPRRARVSWAELEVPAVELDPVVKVSSRLGALEPRGLIINDIQVLTTRQPAISNATDETDVVVAVNQILRAMRAHGLIEP